MDDEIVGYLLAMSSSIVVVAVFALGDRGARWMPRERWESLRRWTLLLTPAALVGAWLGGVPLMGLVLVGVIGVGLARIAQQAALAHDFLDVDWDEWDEDPPYRQA